MYARIPEFNADGQKVLDIHERYHATDDAIIREALEVSVGKLISMRSAGDAFHNADSASLKKYLTASGKFRPGVEDIFDEIKGRIEEYIARQGTGNIEVFHRYTSSMKTSWEVIIERRIGLKASSLQTVLGVSSEEAHRFFDMGHADAFAQTMLCSAVKELLKNFEDVHGRKARIDFDIRSSRKYMANVNVKFVIPAEEFLEDDGYVLCDIVTELKKLDEFKAKYPILY